jgi:hypothetical protein
MAPATSPKMRSLSLGLDTEMMKSSMSPLGMAGVWCVVFDPNGFPSAHLCG